MNINEFSDFLLKEFPSINFSNRSYIEDVFNTYSFSYDKIFKKPLKRILAFKQASNRSVKFWIERGWSQEESVQKVKDVQASIAKRIKEKREQDPVYDQKIKDNYFRTKERQIADGSYDRISKSKGNGNDWSFYLDKINLSTGFFYTEEESRAKVRDKQRKFFDKMWKSIRNKEGIYFCNTNVDYYLNKGFTYKESVEELKNRQATFSLDICIQKYGKDEGLKRFQKRQQIWQTTLMNKTDEEKAEIYQKKLKNFKRYSKVSANLFEKVKSRLESEGIFLTFHFGESEKFIWDKEQKRIFFYDLFIEETNLLVEFNGSLFHPRPYFTESELQNFVCPISKLNGVEILKKDTRKENLAISEGYEYLTVWENDHDNEHLLYHCIKNTLNK